MDKGRTITVASIDRISTSQKDITHSHFLPSFLDAPPGFVKVTAQGFTPTPHEPRVESYQCGQHQAHSPKHKLLNTHLTPPTPRERQTTSAQGHTTSRHSATQTGHKTRHAASRRLCRTLY